MARKIVWSLHALEEKDAIFTFWNEHNKSKAYSRKLNRLFKEAISMLKEHPQIGRKTNIENVHIKIVRQYLIVYKIEADRIIIVRIWDGRRNPDEMF
jgi:plasmid stabilization system protein ParE